MVGGSGGARWRGIRLEFEAGDEVSEVVTTLVVTQIDDPTPKGQLRGRIWSDYYFTEQIFRQHRRVYGITLVNLIPLRTPATPSIIKHHPPAPWPHHRASPSATSHE